MIDNDGFPVYGPGEILTIKSLDQKRMPWQKIAYSRRYPDTASMMAALVEKYHGDRYKIAKDLGIDPGKEKKRLNAMVSVISQRGLALSPIKKIRTGRMHETAPGMTPGEYADWAENEDPLGRGMPGTRGGSFEKTTSVIYDRCGFARAGG